MAYSKTAWTDRAVQYPSRFTMVTNADGTINLTPSPGTITNAGTPITAANLNNLEKQYDDAVTDIENWVQTNAQMFKLTQDSGLSFGPVDVNGVSTSDFNAIKKPGEYYFGSGLTANGPVTSSADAGVIRVRQSDGNVITQEVIYTGGNQVRSNVYVRSYYGINNAWGAWDRLAQVNGDFTKSLGGSGWQKLPSGLILQWGSASSSTATNGAKINFPITFPNACSNVTPIANGNAGVSLGVNYLSTGSFYIYTPSATAIFYTAIGY